MKLSFSLILIALALSARSQSGKYELVISHAKVLDVKSGKVLNDQTLLINAGKIVDIIHTSKEIAGKKNINAKGRLVTPGFIDTHIHPTDVFGDYDKAPEFLALDSLGYLHRKLSDAYLPYGTTTALILGQPEKWLTPILDWQKHPDPQYTDFYTSGAALISDEERTPYIGHAELENPAKAKAKILEYHRLGIKHIKLYYRIRKPEAEAVLKTADSLGMITYGHIGDFGTHHLHIMQALKMGLTNYEHLVTLGTGILTEKEYRQFEKEFTSNYGPADTESKVLEMFLEAFSYIDQHEKHKMEVLIDSLASQHATFSTTIQRMYEQFQPTYFTQPADKLLTAVQLKRCKDNFAILMKYAKLMSDKGIKLRIGTDGVNGGKSLISELIIMTEYGFSIADVFKIATYNGAEAIGIAGQVGTVEKDKQADLIIWDKNPFDDPANFSAARTIIKSGVEYKNQGAANKKSGISIKKYPILLKLTLI
ncbi:amidohydrolase family protein [Pedobacter cryoconitis]|nr:amidohydrolase family protein [Pedobacter cryoconitis]